MRCRTPMKEERVDATTESEYGYRRLARLPTPEELRKYYATKYFQQECRGYQHSYDELETAYIAAILDRKMQALQRFARQLPATGSLLDVGCGEAHTMAYLAARGWETAGVDFSSDGVGRHHPDLVPNVRTGDLLLELE